jgi:alpha-L-fucosidase
VIKQHHLNMTTSRTWIARGLALTTSLMATSLIAADKLEAEKAVPLGKAVAFADPKASGGNAVKALGEPGSGLRFDKVPAAKKIAIRYASKTEMGTYSIQVNEQTPVKVNFHSTGAWDTFYAYTIIDVKIPAGATLKVLSGQGDSEWSVDYILTGNDDLGLKPDIWNLPRFVPAPGKFTPDWKSLDQYQTPEWFREAKFGLWNHFTPEVVPELGDWYYVHMYKFEGKATRENDAFVKRYGHPSEKGFIDLLDLWKCKAWDPAQLMKLYSAAGAKYFVQLANHCDNSDTWNSAYQPFNAVNFGPKIDLVGIMAQEARKSGLRFGVSYHAMPTHTWNLFMPSSYGSDATGDKAGKPYDGRALSLANGAGKFWDGYDPKDFYGPVHAGTANGAFPNGEPKDPNGEMFFRQLFWRQDDLLKYRPDLLYFDTGLCRDGFGIPESAKLIAANFYNKSLEWNMGNLEAVLNFKYPDGQEKAMVIDYEASAADKIQAYPWQTDHMISGWSYDTEYTLQGMHDATWVIRTLASNVARNGNLLLNVPLRADGSLDAPMVALCESFGAWLKVNGEAIYGSRPFERDHEGEVFFTRRGGFIYATTFSWPIGGKLVLEALHEWGRTIGKVQKVEILGVGPVNFTQDGKALTIDCTTKQPEIVGGVRAFVFKVTQDKTWINDDDPGVKYAGWDHTCNLDAGEFNNDLRTSKTPGATCEYTFMGSGIEVIGTRDANFGNFDVSIDGGAAETVSLANPTRQTQTVLFTKAGLSQGTHVIKVVNKGEALVVLDAFNVTK